MSLLTLSPVVLTALTALVGVCYFLMALTRPWWATVAALASLALIPFWLGGSVGGFFISIQLLLAAVAAISILVREKPAVGLNFVDIALTLLLGLSVATWVLGLSTVTQPYTFLQAMVIYWFARLAAMTYGTRQIFTVIAAAFALVAVTMLLEFATGRNPWLEYLAVNNNLYDQWSGLQSRGGVLRAEGPFGHSIAAGCSLAVAATLALGAKLRTWVRITVILLLTSAILVTISRIGMVTAALGIGLAIVFTRTKLSRAVNALVLGVLMLGITTYNLTLAGIFEESGAEAANSAAYRLWLLDLLPLLQPIGYAASFSRSTSGAGSFSSFASIDNFFLEYSLKNGWVPAVVLLVLMGVAILQLLRLRAGQATAAVVAQIPALFTVALITTYGLVFWLSVGLSVSESVIGAQLRRRSTTVDHPKAALVLQRDQA